MTVFRKKWNFCQALKWGTMIPNAGICLLIFFHFSCFIDHEKTQYIVIKNGENLQPYAKVVYKVSVERQEVLYSLEFPGQDPSPVYKLDKCMVSDINNWRGEADNILLWRIRVEAIHGQFSSPGEALVNVDWVTWHFRTSPSPSSLAAIATGFIIGFVALGMIAVALIVIHRLRKWEKKRIEKTAESWSEKIRQWPK